MSKVICDVLLVKFLLRQWLRVRKGGILCAVRSEKNFNLLNPLERSYVVRFLSTAPLFLCPKEIEDFLIFHQVQVGHGIEGRGFWLPEGRGRSGR